MTKVAGSGKGKKASRNKRRSKTWQTSFSTFIFKLIKMVHPDLGVSAKSMAVFNSFANALIDRMADVIGDALQHTGKKTITPKLVHYAINMMFSDELAKHAHSEASKSITKYTSSH